MKKNILKAMALAALVLLTATGCKKSQLAPIVKAAPKEDTLTISPIYTKAVLGVYESVYSGVGTRDMFKLELNTQVRNNFGVMVKHVYIALERGTSHEFYYVPGFALTRTFYELYWLYANTAHPAALIGRTPGSSDIIKEIRMVSMPKYLAENTNVDFRNYEAVARYYGLK